MKTRYQHSANTLDLEMVSALPKAQQAWVRYKHPEAKVVVLDNEQDSIVASCGSYDDAILAKQTLIRLNKRIPASSQSVKHGGYA